MASATLDYPLFGFPSFHRSRSSARSISVQGILEGQIEQQIIEDSILRSQFMQRMENLIELMLETQALNRVKPNWNSYSAEPPKAKAIQVAMKFLSLSAEAEILPTRSLPSAEGGVALRFVSADKRAMVEFLNTGAIEVMLYDEAGVLSPETEELEDQRAILQAVQAHLMR